MYGGRLVGLAATLVLGGCALAGAPPASPTGQTTLPAGTRAAAPTSTPAPLSWGPCTQWQEYQDLSGWQCAVVTVPLDYSQPKGRQIGISIGRLPATDPSQRIGSLLWLQNMVPATSIGTGGKFSSTIHRQFDLIGFDVRGLGNSEGVHCLAERPTLEHPFPRTEAELATFIAAARSIDEACQKNSGWLLPHLGIENAARDLDRIRIALGEEKITLAGNNWAATLDAVYADLFPSHLRAAVLGGPLKPGIDDEVLLTGQAETSQAALDTFLADCAADDACPFHSGGATRQAFDTVMARLAKGPIGGLTEREASTMVYFGLMGTTSDLAKALGAAAKGDVSVLNDMYGWSGVSDPVASDQYDAYNCLDYAWGRSPDAYAALADRLASVSPDFGRMLAFGDFGCAYWPAPPLRPSTTLTAAGAPPILLVAARRDPQTPYAWSAELAKQLSSGVLLTVDSDAVSTVDSNSECARQAVDHYLLTLEPPPAGTTCR